jgi:hypothetical protein
MHNPAFTRRLRLHSRDVRRVRSMVGEYKQGRCVVVEEDGITFVDCLDARDAVDIRIAYPRSEYILDW